MTRRLAERFAACALWIRLICAAFCGAMMALGQSPVSWPVALFLAGPVLFWLWEATDGSRAAFWTGWVAGLGYFAAALFWIVEPFLVDVPRHGWMAPFALLFLAGGLGLVWAVPFGLAHWALRGAGGIARVAGLASLWAMSDYARSHVLTGFPWALPAYSWVETPVIQAAALFGPHLLGGLTLAAALAPGVGLLRGGIAAGALVGLGWVYGSIVLSLPVVPRAEPIVVRLVQPNAEQRFKWRPDMQQMFYERHLGATRAEPLPDVTIWSETAVPFVLGYADALQAQVAEAAGPDGRVILGIQRLGDRPDRRDWYNSLAVLNRDGSPYAVYDKHHLVPFGEYIPLAGLIARLGLPRLTALTGGGFRAGPGPRIVEVPDLPPFLPLICYEAIFPHGMDAPGPRPGWIVQITNDAWFGTLSGPYQHLAQARVRAIEQGLPLARAANTGISAMIDARGRIVQSMGLGEAGHLDVDLPAALPPPLYAQTGDFPSLIVLLVCLGLTVIRNSSGILRKLEP